MKIVSLTWARNESDILESFVRHNASIVDHMVIVLHKTNDNSETILKMLKEEGISLDVRTDKRPLHHQTKCLSKLMHEVAQSEEVDWIVPLDADEFLVSTNGTDPRNKFAEIDENTAHLLHWHTYIPTAQDSSAEPDPLKRITFRKSYEQIPYAKVIVPGKIAAMENAHLTPGNHGVRKGEALLDMKISSTLALAHFPVRSENQLRRKIIQGWRSVKDLPSRKPDEALHWKNLFPRCMNLAPMDAEELKNIAIEYAANSNDLVDLISDPILPRYDRIRYLQRPAALPPIIAQSILPIPPSHPSTLPTMNDSPFQPFTIFCHPRCGSTNLCEILSQHRDIFCASEIYNVDTIWMQRYLVLKLGMNPTSLEDPDAMLQDFFSRCYAHERKPMIGFKIFSHQAPRQLQKGWLLRPKHKVILLSRRNILAAALSCKIAHKTKIYNLRYGETLAIDKPFHIPVDIIRDWIETQRQWMEELRALLISHGKQFYETTYEDHGIKEIAGICEFLGCEPLESYTDCFTKITQPHHYQKIENLSEIIEAFPHENTDFLYAYVTPHTKTSSCEVPEEQIAV